jgi:hypothetical protein
VDLLNYKKQTVLLLCNCNRFIFFKRKGINKEKCVNEAPGSSDAFGGVIKL